jgi:hypothetical protein
MPEFTYIDGVIGDAGYHVVCDDVLMSGSVPLVSWLTDLLGPTPYSPANVFNLSPQTIRLFGGQRTACYDSDGSSMAARPMLSHIEPASIALLGADVTLHVYGAGFVQRSVIVFNGGPEPTVFVNPYELTTVITGASATTAGRYPVQVETPAPGGGISPARWFHIVSPTEQTVKRWSRDRSFFWLLPIAGLY